MLTKLHSQHGRNKNYIKPKSDTNMVFGLNHFAGVVVYNAQGMVFVLYFLTWEFSDIWEFPCQIVQSVNTGNALFYFS